MTRVAVFGRADASGLGSMTLDFCRHMHPDRVGIMDMPGRGGVLEKIPASWVRVPAPGCLKPDWWEQFLEGIDVLVGFETFYRDTVFLVTERRKVKTVMFPMWECSPPWIEQATVLACLSDEDMKYYPRGVRMSWPMDRENFPQHRIFSPPRRFVHNAGGLGLHGRNGTREVIRASAKLQALGTIPLTVRTNEMLPPPWLDGSRWCDVRVGYLEDRRRLYHDADVLVFPMRFAGLSLPMLEAAASMIPTLVLDLPEWSHYAPEMRVPTCGSEIFRIGWRMVEYHKPDIEALGDRLVSLAKGDIFPQYPPQPPTWSDFAKAWNGMLAR